MAFGTHVTPMPRETLGPFPSLDFGLRGEPDLTLRDVIDHLEGRQFNTAAEKSRRCSASTIAPTARRELPTDAHGRLDLAASRGWSGGAGRSSVVNPDRPFIADLDDLPMPLHQLLPLDKYRIPLIKGPYTFIVTSRGCPAGCTFCIKHVSYGPTMRLRSPEKLVEEIQMLVKLGVRNVHMYADLFTVNRDQVDGAVRPAHSRRT